MRFLCMHKVDAKMERGERPGPELIQNMGQLIGRSLKAGIFKDGAGLHRSATRARVTFDASGRASVERGPYAGSNELIASMVLVSLPTGIERAIGLATELGKAAGNREIEVGPVVEGWDLNGSARPADAPFRFLLLVKGDAAFEAGASQRPPAVTALLDQWKRDGVLASESTLRPTKTAARSNVVGGKRQWTDGPFAESKELIAGFSVLELPSIEDAKQFTAEFAAIIGDNEIDVRELV